MTETALLNSELNIKVKNLLQVHLYNYCELRPKQNKMRNVFQMSRDWIYIALVFRDNELKKARKKLNVWKKMLEKRTCHSALEF